MRRARASSALAIWLRSGIASATSGVLAALLLAGGVAAQDLPREEAERPGRELGEAERAAETGRRSELLPELAPGETVSYADVLARPDDLRLNYLYAQSLIRQGELRGAAATLDRILMLHPELAEVRLLYATVLYRLDNLPEAEREFRRLLELEMPRPLRRRVEATLREIERRQRRTRGRLQATLGAEYDSNRNAGPRSDELLFLGSRFDVAPESRDEDDVSWIGILDLDVEHDLETQAGHQLRAGLSYYVQEQTELNDLDLQAGTARLGARLRSGLGDLDLEGYQSVMTLSSETFLRESGVRAEATRRRSAGSDWLAAAWVEYEDFDGVDSSEELFERTGFVWGIDAGARWRLGPAEGLEARLFFVDKHAQRSHFAYRGAGATGHYTWLLGRGQFLVASATLEWDVYDEGDPLVDHTRRRDLRWRQQLLYGLPLDLLIPWAEPPGWLSALRLSTIAEYFRSSSNQTNYTYDNWKLTLLFTRSIDF